MNKMKPKGTIKVKIWVSIDRDDGELLDAYVRKPNPKYDNEWENSKLIKAEISYILPQTKKKTLKAK